MGAEWICPTCGGEYPRRICDKTPDDSDCPYCHGTKLLTGYNDLATTDPDLAALYSSKNDRPASMVRKDWNKYVYWECPECHYVHARRLNEKAPDNSDCPACNHVKTVQGVNTLQAEFPEIAKNLSPNNDFTADEILSTTYRSAKWICPTCGGEYFALVKDMVEGIAECPYCNNQRPLAGFNTLKVLYPEIAKEMNPNNEKGPDDVLPTSAYLAEWTCSKCGYTYKASVKDRVKLGNLCPACAGKKAQAGLNSLLDVYPEIQDEWAVNENALLGIFPDEILPTSTARVWWECKDCGRKYLLSVNMWVEKHIRGMTSCTYCSGLRMRETHVLLQAYKKYEFCLNSYFFCGFCSF